VPAVYEATSGWVHFSPAHLYAAWQLEDAADERAVGRTVGGVPIRPNQIPLSALQELLGAMIQATEELFGYVEVWESRKGLRSGQEVPWESASTHVARMTRRGIPSP
jgi:hypothetical protein